MKKLLISIVTLLVVNVAQAQLSKNFYSQFKALLETKFDDLKGEKITEEEDEWGIVTSYESKKPLDGFSVELGFGDHVFGEIQYATGTILITNKNIALFEDIRKEIKKLVNQGYTFKDEKSNPEFISELLNKKIEVEKNNVSANIWLTTDKKITFEIFYW